MTDYDVVVVGADVAGLPTALFTGAMGLRTLVIEASARFMRKTLLNASEG